MRHVLPLLCLLLSFSPSGRTGEFPKGKLIPEVACAADPEETYALYLPSTYTPDKKWPVIFGFSPGARGQDPVQLLRHAAETYGYIVVGSNNARNGPYEPILKAMKAMWADVNERFNVHPQRAYSTGFSGGARVALHLALSKPDRFAGVISCGAFFSNNAKLPDAIPFAVFGLVGNADFNQPEMNRADAALAERKVAHWIEEFNGPHRWPAAGLMTEAVEFMQVVAMRNQQIPMDAAFVQTLVAARLAAAKALAEKTPLLALRKYRQTASFFAGTPGADDAAAAAKALTQRDDVKAALAAAKEFARHEQNLRRGPGSAAFKSAVAWMRKTAAGGGSTAQKAIMTLQGLLYALQRQGSLMLANKQYAQAAPMLEAAADLLPAKARGAASCAYNAACAYARLGKKSKALALLKRAVDAGFRDLAHIQADEDLESLRQEPAYKEIIASLAKRK